MELIMKAIVFFSFFFFLVKNVFSETSIGGLIFVNYNFYYSNYRSNGSNTDNYNTFDIGRIYLSASNNHKDNYFSKVTLEANTLSNGNNVFLKFAYLEKREEDFNIKVGLIPSLWVGFEEGIWKNVFVEYTQMHYLKVINPSDKGISFKYEIEKLNSSFETMISNGEGFKTIENSKTKNLDLKYSYKKNGFNFSSFFSSNIGDREKEVLSSLFGFENKKFSAALSVFKSINFSTSSIHSTGFSIYSNINISDKYTTFLRWDRYDKNTKKYGDISDYYIFGILRNINEDIKVAISFKETVPQIENSSNKKEAFIQSSFYVKF